MQRILSQAKVQKDYTNIRYAFKVLLVIIETFKGKIDNIVKDILVFIICELNNNSTKNKNYKTSLFETVIIIFFLKNKNLGSLLYLLQPYFNNSNT